MKKILFTLLPLTLLVVSCSRGELSNSSQSEINSLPESFTSENTSLEEVQSLWNETTKQNLMSVIGELIPFVQLDQNYTSVIDSDEDGYYVYIYDEATTNLLSNYGNTLSSNGYEFYAQDDSYGYDIYMYTKQKGNDQIAIQYDFYPGNEQNPVIESDILDMTNNSQLTSFDDNQAVWKASKATLIITKGTSEHTVGNGSFYYNPARVYAGQVMTFSWGEGNTPSSIVITCKSNEYATVISSSSLSGCSASSNGLVVTLTNLTNNCSITLSKQSRITSIEFKYE